MTSRINERNQKTYKECNAFLHPSFYFVDGNGSNAHRVAKQRFTVRLTVGSKIIPEHAIESPQEALYHLLQALGLTAMRDSIAAAGHGYSRLGHIMAFNTESYTGAGEDYDGLGLSTRGSEGIQLQITGNEGGAVIDAAGNIPVGGALVANPMEKGVLTRAYLTIVSSLKIMLKTGVCQVSD